MRLSRLLEGCAPAGSWPAGDPEVAGLADDTRRLGADQAFFSRRGAAGDGAAFAAQACAAGARLVVGEPPLPPGVPPALFVPVADSRAALARACRNFFGDPSRALALFGVTGTNGKTTTATLLRSIFAAADGAAGLIGTLGHSTGRRLVPAANTTPGLVELNELLAEIAAGGARRAVLEVSSHALEQGRVAGLAFAGAVLTSLGRDHLDYHRTPAAYREAKRRLFAGLEAGAVAVLNRDEPFARDFARGCRARIWWYSAREPADAWPKSFRLAPGGSELELALRGGASLALRSPLEGPGNLANLLAAAAAARAAGCAPEEIKRGLEAVAGLPGRFEHVAGPPGAPRVLVDFAHTPEALAGLLAWVRRSYPGLLVVVFGCGGDRDRGKRPQMGRVAAELADVAVLTSDNPRSEPPQAILAEIEAGLARGFPREVISDRREAIRVAVQELAGPGDVVVIAGKGHETAQLAAGTSRHFDDRETAREFLGAAGGRI